MTKAPVSFLVAGRLVALQGSWQQIGQDTAPLLRVALDLQADAECARRLQELQGKVVHIRFEAVGELKGLAEEGEGRP